MVELRIINTMNLNFKLTPDRLLCRQIIDQVRTKVALGELKANDRLPPIRDLARQLGLNPSTVARAYLSLERDGVITTHAGRGSFVAPGAVRKISDLLQRKQLDICVEKSIIEALGLGFTLDDINTAFTLRMATWKERQTGKRKAITIPDSDVIRFQGSHDIALELLGSHVSSAQPAIRFEMSFVGSIAGIVALAGDEADVAGSHLIDEDSGEYNISHVKKIMPNETVLLITLMQRIQGFIIKPGNPKQIIDFRDLARPDVTFINRQKGSGTRILLDSQLRKYGVDPLKVKGYSRVETTHIGVAQAVVQEMADVGLGAQSAAVATGLDFIPLIKERYDLIVLKEKAEKTSLSLMIDIVKSEQFQSVLRAIPGYDTSFTGQITTVSPNKK